MLLPLWCTVCHWLRLMMKIIYCVSGFPSMCYMTWGVCATINLFTVASSPFVPAPVMRLRGGVGGTSECQELLKGCKRDDKKKTYEKRTVFTAAVSLWTALFCCDFQRCVYLPRGIFFFMFSPQPQIEAQWTTTLWHWVQKTHDATFKRVAVLEQAHIQGWLNWL